MRRSGASRLTQEPGAGERVSDGYALPFIGVLSRVFISSNSMSRNISILPTILSVLFKVFICLLNLFERENYCLISQTLTPAKRSRGSIQISHKVLVVLPLEQVILPSNQEKDQGSHLGTATRNAASPINILTAPCPSPSSLARGNSLAESLPSDVGIHHLCPHYIGQHSFTLFYFTANEAGETASPGAQAHERGLVSI